MTYRHETIVTLTIYCDGPCGDRTAQSFSARSIAEAYRQAYQRGWVTNRVTGKAECQSCRPKRKNGRGGHRGQSAVS